MNGSSNSYRTEMGSSTHSEGPLAEFTDHTSSLHSIKTSISPVKMNTLGLNIIKRLCVVIYKMRTALNVSHEPGQLGLRNGTLQLLSGDMERTGQCSEKSNIQDVTVALLLLDLTEPMYTAQKNQGNT